MTIKLMANFCGVVAIVLLLLAALGPANWAPRTEFGWQIDHFVGYFVITSIVCFAWPRPFVVGPALMAVAALLEGLQTAEDKNGRIVEIRKYGSSAMVFLNSSSALSR